MQTTTRWIRKVTKKYARKAGIKKRIHPHLFRHQLLTFLTLKGIIDLKLQLIRGHQNRQNLSNYQDLNLADVENEHKEAMKDFPVQIKIGTKVIQHRSYSSVGSNKLKARLNGNGR